MPELLDAIADAVGTRVWRVPLSPAAYVGLVWVWGQLSRIVGSLPPYTAERARESVAPDWSCDDSRARRELGFTSELSLIDGMRATAAWYRAQGLIT
jgi:nucleoside-diphosphate-sugar epimerase